MAYFQPFPDIAYQFGNSEKSVAFPDLTAYVDMVDRLKDNLAFYSEYYVQEGDRPDQVSTILYKTPNYYWTFYLMNDHIREQGWPLTERQLKIKAKKEFPNTTLTTSNELTNKLKVGTVIKGLGSGATGTIIHRRLDFGQLIVETTDTFQAGEVITAENDTSQSVQIRAQSEEFNATAHYIAANGRIRDVEPYNVNNFGGGLGIGGYNGTFAIVTFIDELREQNNNLKRIKVPRPDVVFDITNTFTDEMLNA